MKSIKIDYAQRIKKLPPYLFIKIDQKKKELLAQGKNIIDLGVGDPDQPTPSHIVRAGQKALSKPENQQYPFGAGLLSFRKAVADWYRKRFGVQLDPLNEVSSLLGSKEGLGHFHFAFLNPGDYVLVPEPAYPVYYNSAILVGAKPYFMPLLAENNFLPDLNKIPLSVAKKSKIIFLNYPNNPTSALANRYFYEKVIKFALKYNLIVCQDNAYSEIYYEEKPLSFLELPGAKEVGVEFHSLSKTYNMTGWRLGWVCGNAQIIAGLRKVKDNLDSGVFQAIQEAGISALTGSQDCVEKMRRLYRKRRDTLVNGLLKLGWQLKSPSATFYVWAKTPVNQSSTVAVTRLLEDACLVATPGSGFGPSGEGYVRFTLTKDVLRIQEAIKRMAKIHW